MNQLNITFNEKLIATEQIQFETYNTDTLVTTTYTFTWVDDERGFKEILVNPLVTVTIGTETAINFEQALQIDFASGSDFTISRNENTVYLVGISEDIEFQNGNNFGNDVTFAYVTYVPPVIPTKDSYFFEFTDVEGILHRVNIAYAPNTDNWIEVQGSCVLELAEQKDPQIAIKPSTLKISLEANTDVTFEDLYEEEERVYKVTYIRNSQTLFNGWLSSDGLYESFVNDTYYIDLQAIDGLGYLKDLSYVDIDTSLTFVGKQTPLEIIVNCLKHTKISQNIRTSIGLYYTGLSTGNILSQIYFNSEQFLKEDGETIMSCEDVLKSVLEIFNATIISTENYWYAYRSSELVSNSGAIPFYEYDSDGVFVDEIEKSISFELGSQINEYYPHHASGNQQKSIERSLGAYRLNFKYGRVFPFYENVDLVWNNSSSIDDWTIDEPTEIKDYTPLRGFLVYRPASTIQVVATSDAYTTTSDNPIELLVTFSNSRTTLPPGAVLDVYGTALNMKVKYTHGGGGGSTKYLTKDGDWVNSAVLIQHAIGFGEQDFTLRIISKTLPNPSGADIVMEIYNAGFNFAKQPLIINKIVLQTYRGEEQPQGKNYTIEKIANFTPSTNNEVKTVVNGDIIDNTYYSTIYKSDETTSTSTWYRVGVSEQKEILRIMVEDKMRMAFNPRIVFEGGIYGYVPFFSKLRIINVRNNMYPIQYSYDAKNNRVDMKTIELLNVSFEDEDVFFSIQEDYGNVVKPTIKG